MPDGHYDLIVIGSGPGGASLAHRLAPDRQAHPAARARRLSAALAGELGCADRLRGRGLPGTGNLVRARRSQLSSGAALLRRRQLQGLRRRSVATARARFRGDPPSRTASRRPGRSRTPSSSPTMPRPSGCSTCTASAARIRPNRRPAARFRYPPVSHEPRIQALSDNLIRVGPASVPSASGHSAGRESRQAHPDQHLHPLRCLRRLSRACSTARRMRRSCASIRRWPRTRTSRC